MSRRPRRRYRTRERSVPTWVMAAWMYTKPLRPLSQCAESHKNLRGSIFFRSELTLLRQFSTMKHFEDVWIDFPRSEASSSKAAELKRHLDQCAKCRTISELWSAVIEIVRREEEYRPSDHAVRSAKAMYGLRRALESLTGKEADLIFDSFRAPL